MCPAIFLVGFAIQFGERRFTGTEYNVRTRRVYERAETMFSAKVKISG